MNTLQTTFRSTEVRIADDDPVTIVLKDVADALGYRDAGVMKRSIKERYCVTHEVRDASGRINRMICVTRPGLSQALATLQPQDAEKREKVDSFQDWLYEEVLESIYDTGSYEMGEREERQPVPSDDPIIQMRQEQLQAQREREEMKSEISQLREERDQALKQLEAAPKPQVDVPEKDVRDEVGDLVRSHAFANGDFGRAWTRLYKEYRQRAGIDLKRRAGNRDDANALDIAEELDVIDELYRVAYDLYA